MKRLSIIVPVLLFVLLASVAISQSDIGKPITEEHPLPQSELDRLKENPPTIDIEKLKKEMPPEDSGTVVVAGRETAGATISSEIFPPATVKLPPEVYADGIVITQNCPPDVKCGIMPQLVLRTLDDRDIAWVDGNGELVQREENGRFADVQIIKAKVSK